MYKLLALIRRALTPRSTGDHPVRVPANLDTAGRSVVEAYTQIPLRADLVHAVMLRAESAFRSLGELEAALVILSMPRPDLAKARAHIRCYIGNLTQSSHGVTVSTLATVREPGGEE